SQSEYGVELRLLADKAIVPEKVFAAVNLAYQPFVGQGANETSGAHLSKLDVDLAATAAIGKNVFFGGELRYVSGYEGLLPQNLVNWSLFAGPTLYVALGDSGYVGVAWEARLTGRSLAPGVAIPNEFDFGRQQIKVKSGF